MQVSGVSARRNGNYRPDPRARTTPIPCAGVDQWCAIDVETDEQWRALREAIGAPAWAMDPAARHRRPAGGPGPSEIDRELGAFTAPPRAAAS